MRRLLFSVIILICSNMKSAGHIAVNYCLNELDKSKLYREKSLAIKKMGYGKGNIDCEGYLSLMANKYNRHYSDSLFSVGVQLYKAHNYYEAINVFEKCDRYDRVFLNEADNRLVYCTKWIGCCYYHLGDKERAKEYNSLYYEYPPIDRGLITKPDSLFNISQISLNAGDTKETINKINDAIEEEKLSIGYQNYWVARAIESCGYLYEKIDSMQAALECHKKALNIRSAVLNESHGDIGMSLVNIADCSQQLGLDTLKAIDDYVKGFNIISKIGYSYYPHCAFKMQKFSRLLEEVHDYESAISYSLQTITLFKRLGGNNDEINGYVFERYSSVMQMCCSIKRYGDAEKYGDKALKLAKELYGENNPHYSKILSLFSSIYAKVGKYDKAVQMDSLLLANFKVVKWDSIKGNEEIYQYQMYLGFLDQYIEHLRENGDYDKAISQFDTFFETLAKCSSLFEDSQFVYLKYNLLLAECYAKKGFYTKAIEIVKSILQGIRNPISKKYESFKKDCIFELMGYYAGIKDFKQLNKLVAQTDVYKGNKDFENNQNSLNFLFGLYEVFYDNKERKKESINLMSEAERIAVAEKDTITLLNCYSNLAISYYDIGEKEKALYQVKKALYVIEGSKYQDQEIYAEFLSQTAYFYGLLNIVDSSNIYHNKAYEYGIKLKAFRFINNLKGIGYNSSKKGDYDNAVMYIRKAIDERKKNGIVDDLSDDFVDLFVMYSRKGDRKKQIETAKEYFSIFSDVSEKNYLLMLKGICKGLFDNEDYDEAIKYGLMSVDCHKIVYGENSSELITPIYDLSLTYFEAGNYVKGIEYGQYAVRIMEANTNKYSESYVHNLESIATFYNKIGKKDECLETRYKVLEIITDMYGEESPEVAMVLHNLAVDYSEKGDIVKAIELDEKVVNIRRERLGTDHYLYARTLGNLGILLSDQGKYEDAIEKLQESLSVERNCYGDSSMHVATRLVDLGKTYHHMMDSVRENKCYQEAYSILRKQDSYNSSVSSDALFVKQAVTSHYYDSGLYSDCSEVLCQELSELKERITSDLIKLQEQYRSIVWDKNSSPFLVTLPKLAYVTRADSLIERMYDYSALFGKGLMLNSHNTISQIVMNSDSLSKDRYKELNEIRALKEVELSKSIENRIEDVDILDAKIKMLEDSLNMTSVDYATYKKNLDLTWRDIQSKLRDKDLAIEFYSVAYPDSVIYMALTVKKEYQHPKLTRLFDLKEMPKWKRETEETKNFYKLIWEPLEQEFEGVDNIFFSTWYRLNSIPLENLPNSQGQYMSDIYNMYRLSSTRELVTSQVRPACSNIAIYGGLDYNNINSTVSLDTSSYISAYRGVLDSINARGGVDYLPYSLEEAKSIAKEARRFGISNSVYMGTNGTEESFKRLSNSNVDLIHLATHGFYYNADVAKNAAQNLNYQFLFKKGTTEEKALNRSFLIMSGGNRLTHRDSIPEGKDDGILTAKEVSIMNLQNVGLLVLSACQSGLGDSSSEGVMGLQQGFKKAGVNAIIMALDNIDDEATQLFMEFFYKHLFSGKSKRESMTNAQRQLRTYKHGKYDDPKYWASFIMLDGLN